jgi:hypothetical protein
VHEEKHAGHDHHHQNGRLNQSTNDEAGQGDELCARPSCLMTRPLAQSNSYFALRVNRK